MEKFSHKNIRKLSRNGKSSYVVNIPKKFIRKLGWRERQKLQLTLKGKKVIVEDAA